MHIEIVECTKFHQFAADIFTKVMLEHATPNICFPTGDTPTGLYQELVARYRNKVLSLTTIRAFGLDEWGLLDSHDPARCSTRMHELLYNQTDVNPKSIHFLEPNRENIEAECAAYEHLIHTLGGLTMSILGVGMNGHIGFNEPGSKITDRTRVVELDSTTLAVGHKYGFENTPQFGVTIGLATILESKQILMMVNGLHKAGIVRKLIHEPVTESFPASLLHAHSNCTLLLDTDAACLL